MHAVLKESPEWLRPIAALLAFTGMRRGELLGLRWLDVDRKGGRIMLPQTKNGTGRVVWLSEMALAVLDSLPAGHSTELVFPPTEQVTPANVSVRLRRTAEKLGIADFRLHDLRHTAASWMVMTGADLYTVSKLLGHKDIRMTERYAHFPPRTFAAPSRVSIVPSPGRSQQRQKGKIVETAGPLWDRFVAFLRSGTTDAWRYLCYTS